MGCHTYSNSSTERSISCTGFVPPSLVYVTRIASELETRKETRNSAPDKQRALSLYYLLTRASRRCRQKCGIHLSLSFHLEHSDPLHAYNSCLVTDLEGASTSTGLESAISERGDGELKLAYPPRTGPPVSAPVSASLRLFLRRNQKASPAMAMTARPPTTPPAMAPAGEELDFPTFVLGGDVGPIEGVELVVEVELGVADTEEDVEVVVVGSGGLSSRTKRWLPSLQQLLLL